MTKDRHATLRQLSDEQLSERAAKLEKRMSSVQCSLGSSIAHFLMGVLHTATAGWTIPLHAVGTGVLQSGRIQRAKSEHKVIKDILELRNANGRSDQSPSGDPVESTKEILPSPDQHQSPSGEVSNRPGEVSKSPGEVSKSPGELSKPPGEVSKPHGELQQKNRSIMRRKVAGAASFVARYFCSNDNTLLTWDDYV